jgi:hypothetical protein
LTKKLATPGIHEIYPRLDMRAETANNPSARTIDLLLAFLFIKFWGRRDAYPTRKNGEEWDGHLARPRRELFKRSNEKIR